MKNKLMADDDSLHHKDTQVTMKGDTLHDRVADIATSHITGKRTVVFRAFTRAHHDVSQNISQRRTQTTSMKVVLNMNDKIPDTDTTTGRIVIMDTDVSVRDKDTYMVVPSLGFHLPYLIVPPHPPKPPLCSSHISNTLCRTSAVYQYLAKHTVTDVGEHIRCNILRIRGVYPFPHQPR